MTTPKWKQDGRDIALFTLRESLIKLREAERSEAFFASMSNEYRRGRILAGKVAHPVLKEVADALEVRIREIEARPVQEWLL